MDKYLTIFFIYSFGGWFLESVGGILNVKKFVNRGFLMGPLCPVYGIGVVLITIFLQRYVNDILVLYFMSILICGILEYFTSYVMEKVFHARWWDYQNMKFNINGRICLETLIPFGLVGTIVVKYLNPIIFKLLEDIPNSIKSIVLGVMSIIFLIDITVSFSVIFNFRKNVKTAEKEIKDNTDEIVEKVKEEAEKFIEDKIIEFEDFKYKISLNLYETQTYAKYRSDKLQKRIKKYRTRMNEEWKETKERLEKMSKKIINSSSELKKTLESSSLELKKSINDKKQNMEEIKKQIKENFVERAKANRASKRLLNAFPKMEVLLKNKKDDKKH